MAISTYAELQAAGANWLVRGDLTARIVEFISLAEARLNRVVRKRQAEIDYDLTATPGSRSIALPATYSEARNLWIDRGEGRRQDLRFIDPALLETQEASGEPRRWTINGANLQFDRPCDQAYDFVLRMLAKYALSDASPTNTLLTDAPDVYLFATLCEAAPFLRDPDLMQTYEAKLAAAIRDLNAKDARSRSTQTLSTEPGQLTAFRSRSGYSITTDR